MKSFYCNWSPFKPNVLATGLSIMKLLFVQTQTALNNLVVMHLLTAIAASVLWISQLVKGPFIIWGPLHLIASQTRPTLDLPLLPLHHDNPRYVVSELPGDVIRWTLTALTDTVRFLRYCITVPAGTLWSISLFNSRLSFAGFCTKDEWYKHSPADFKWAIHSRMFWLVPELPPSVPLCHITSTYRIHILQIVSLCVTPRRTDVEISASSGGKNNFLTLFWKVSSWWMFI